MTMINEPTFAAYPKSNGYEPILNDSEKGFTSPKCRVPLPLKEWYAARKPSGVTEQAWFGELLEKALLLEKQKSGVEDALKLLKALSPEQQAEVIAQAKTDH